MNILITGHKGFIGSVLYQHLKKHHKVFGIDLKDGDDLLSCMFPKNIDLVIHLAGKSGVRESLNDPAAYWHNNIESSRRLFNFYNDTRIIYASSSSAYEPDLNPYAASKYVLEELAERYPNTLGLRLHTVYSDNPRKGMFMDKLISNTLEYTTNHYRDFIHVNDVIDAIDILIKKEHIKGIIDVGTGHPIKISDLAPNLPIRLNTPGERQFTCANTDVLKSLGWKNKYTLENFLTLNKKSNIIHI